MGLIGGILLGADIARKGSLSRMRVTQAPVAKGLGKVVGIESRGLLVWDWQSAETDA